MMVSKVKGAFSDFTADIEMDPEDLTSAKLNFSVAAASVDTRQAQRDGHLKSEDFFNVEKISKRDFFGNKKLQLTAMMNTK